MESFQPNDDEIHEKIKIDCNDYFQPIGAKVPKLSNIIGTLVKGNVLSMAYNNWTSLKHKEDVWTSFKYNSLCQHFLYFYNIRTHSYMSKFEVNHIFVSLEVF